MRNSTAFLPPIRTTVRAVILRDDRLLVQVKRHAGEPDHLTLPGGAQELGETLPESVARECHEEVDADVTVGALLHVAEVFKPKGGRLRHQVEMFFACSVPDGYEARLGPAPDRSQVDTIWADPYSQATLFKPRFVETLLDPDAPFYLGTFHG